MFSPLIPDFMAATSRVHIPRVMLGNKAVSSELKGVSIWNVHSDRAALCAQANRSFPSATPSPTIHGTRSYTKYA